MTGLQKRILWVALWLNLIINGACLGACLWSDYQMEKDGISIEAILTKQEYVR